jgi:hypothetical protein
MTDVKFIWFCVIGFLIVIELSFIGSQLYRIAEFLKKKNNDTK